jgi:nucleoside-diphosphate-sugar epimerase
LKVLVVGGTRFLGYHLTWRLVAGGHEVTLFNRGRLDDPFGARVERLRGDRTTDDLARLLQGRSFDAAVDFAAYEGRDAEEVVRVLGGRVGHYVAISSGQVYLVRAGCPRPSREEDYAGELMAPPPAGHADRGQWDYGMGKRAVEDVLAEAWESRRFPATRLRLPVVNGERDHSRRLEGYVWRVLDGGPILVPDGGGHRLRHVYSGDVVRALVGLLGNERTFGRAYNLCQDETPTLAELLTRLAEALGAPARLVPIPAPELEKAGLDPVAVSPFSGGWMSFLDPRRARAELGFTHRSVAEYLDRIVAAWLAAPPAEPPPVYAGRDREREIGRTKA